MVGALLKSVRKLNLSVYCGEHSRFGSAGLEGSKPAAGRVSSFAGLFGFPWSWNQSLTLVNI